jgi:very-short-patch-repair endonuclease
LPAPSGQVVRVDGEGRRRYLDLHWERYRVTVEIDGGQHREVSAWWADMDRQNEVVLATDGVVLRFPALALRLFPERVAGQIRRALVAAGWAS